MPCALWTTGSPTLSSDKSLIRASTSLTCSCFFLLRAAGAIANSSVSVMKSMPVSNQLNPTCRCEVAIPIFSWDFSKSCKESKTTGLSSLALKKSKRLSRRPSLSAKMSKRWAVFLAYSSSRSSGSVAPRITIKSGKDCAKVFSLLAAL